MSDFSVELASEQIHDQRSKEYFQEVLGSFINGNYRSAVVMLWSVVVADFVFKLQALRDLYQDPVATSILDAIGQRQTAAPTSSEWEPFLIEEINNRTHFLETGDYQHLVNLQKLRHLSAHPVLSSANLLFSPNKETTRSLIRNALEAVLLKPPIFSKRIVNEFVVDIAAKKELLPDQQALSRYLNAKYFRGLHLSVEQELLKALWKFCFRTSNPDTDANRDINSRALKLLFQRHPVELRQFITLNAESFSEVAPNGAPLGALINFLSEFPSLFNVLTDAARVPLAAYVDTDVNLLAIAAFTSNSFGEHLNRLQGLEYESLRKLSDESWKHLLTKAEAEGLNDAAHSIAVKIYTGSLSFDSADSNFARFITPIIEGFSSASLILLLDGIEGNNQTHWRGRARLDHQDISARVAAVGGIDLTPYPNFRGSLNSA